MLRFRRLWGGFCEPDSQMTPAQINTAVAARFKLDPATMIQRTRTRAIAWPRQLAMALMREAGYSWPRIARFYGIHHTSVIHGVEACRARCQADPAWRGHHRCMVVIVDAVEGAERPKRSHDVSWVPSGRMDEYRSLRRNVLAHEAKALILTGAMPSPPPSAT